MKLKLPKIFFVIIGFLAVGLGVLGTFLPILPTTPFLLLALYCFAKGSDRFYNWFISTKLYKEYLDDFVRTRTMSTKTKVTILTAASLLLLSVIVFAPMVWLKILCGVLLVIKYYVFIFRIKNTKSTETASSSTLLQKSSSKNLS